MMRALIVDDQPENVYFLRVLLQGHGFEVEEARHGAEALTRARRAPPDVVISDLLMPVLDGYALLREWKLDDRLRSVPFVVYTATFTGAKDERLALAMGADAFIVKPAEPEDLMTRLRSVVASGARPARVAAPGLPPEEVTLLKDYNEVLVRKLEKKALELAESNRVLLDEIEEHRQAVAEVGRTNQLLRAVTDGTSDAVFAKDRDGRYLLYNAAAARFIGKSAEEVLGKDDRDLLGPEEAAQVMANDRRVMESNEPLSIEETLSGGGVRRTFHTVKSPYRNERGEAIGVIGVARDMTERRRAEESLLLRDRAIRSVSQGIIIADLRLPDSPIIFASAGFERITGYRAEEVLGKNCRFLQGKDTDRDTVTRLREAIAERRACVVEILNYRKDGTPFWNALSLNPVEDEVGAIRYFVGVQSDITERRKLEEQLRQSQKMEAVGRLAGGVAHDFNNLLTVIGGYSEELLAKAELGDAVREPVMAIKLAGERAAGLTRQLLGFSRQSILTPVVLDLNDVVTETGRLIRRLIGEDIRLRIIAEPRLEKVKVDPSQLDQVLLNLSVNARDAMPDGGELTIETSNVTLSEEFAAKHLDCAAGPHVLLAVTDTGSGMAPEVLARVFEPFFTTKERGKGTGLGLAVVFGIVRQCGGGIHVYSEPGHGSTFKIYLPVVAEQAPRRVEPPATASVRGTETVLLVEDDVGVRALALIILRRFGYQVLVATDGLEALKIAQAHTGPIDLILTDIVMPNLGGPELVKRLKPQLPDMRVLYMSGYTDNTVVRYGLLEAQLAFIQKPYTPIGLARKIRELLDSPGESAS